MPGSPWIVNTKINKRTGEVRGMGFWATSAMRKQKIFVEF
jgi:hypothetical protein